MLLATCPCEPVADMVRNLKSRTDTTADNLDSGWRYPCGDDGTTERCDFHDARWRPADWREVDRHAFEVMRAQVSSDATVTAAAAQTPGPRPGYLPPARLGCRRPARPGERGGRQPRRTPRGAIGGGTAVCWSGRSRSATGSGPSSAASQTPSAGAGPRLVPDPDPRGGGRRRRAGDRQQAAGHHRRRRGACSTVDTGATWLLDQLSEVPVAGLTVPIPAITFPIELTVHNVVIDEEADMLYLVGSGAVGAGILAGVSDSVCSLLDQSLSDNQGLLGFDISQPQLPVLAGCHAEQGYVHDAHCATYHGPDAEHQGKSICVTAHEDGVAWVDMSDPSAPVTLFDTATAENSEELYPGAAYSHQGWMSEDQTRYFHGDELDEDSSGTIPTRTFVFDMTDLDDVKLEFINEPGGTNIDHNMYTHRGLLFQSNYTAGLQVFDQEPVVDPETHEKPLEMVAEFDVYPDCVNVFDCDAGT